MMCLTPDAVRAMDFEDVIALAETAGLEAEEAKQASGSSKPGTKTSRFKKR